MNKIRYAMFAMTVFIALALSAMNTVPVLADDTTPPPADTTAGPTTPPVVDGGTVTDPPPAVDGGAVTDPPPAVDEGAVTDPPPAVEESAVTDPPPVVDESVITDPPPAVDESAAIDVPPADTATEPATLPELLDQLPAGTDVVVTDANGEIVPLATDEAAQIIASGDPMWCPVGVAPGGVGCSPEELSFNWPGELLSWLIADDPGVAGVIWVSYDYAAFWEPSTAPIILNGNNFTTMDNFALTIQGGWNGTLFSTALNSTTPYSTFNNQLQIINWTGAVTINNINVSVSGVDITTDDYALIVETNGNITLNTVNVQNNSDSVASNTMSGAFLNNYSGSGNVTVNNSNFINNQGSGLVIWAGGAVTTNNLVAAANGGDGVYIDNWWGSTAKPVRMKGIKQFIGNGGNGLVIQSYGAITISSIVATDNGRNGVLINNTWGSYLTVPVYSLVSITGSNVFNNNVNNGLEVYSFGTIAVSNVTALSNGGDGVYLDNCILDSSHLGIGDCLAKSAKSITVSGTNIFNNNGFGSDGLNGYWPDSHNGCFYDGLTFGLEICSAGGAIMLSNTTASYNAGAGGGMFADNRLSNFTGKKLAGALTLTGYGTFNGNSNFVGYGLEAWTFGVLTLNNITANDNGFEGAYLRALNVFTLNGYGIFNNNGGEGLHLQTSSVATLNNVTANDNGGYGVSVTSWRLGDLAFAGVTFKGVNTFNGNGDDGLHVETDGAILLSNVTANGNGGDGADLCNYFDTGSGYLCNDSNLHTADLPWIWDGNGSSAGKGVTLSGVNTFNGNWNNGLLANSNGAIMVSNLTANNNGRSGASGSGAVLNNYQGNPALTPRLVTLTGPVNVNYNFEYGLNITSLGAVSLGNITATYNTTGNGVYIDNQWNWIKQNGVTITGLNNQFNNNGWTGLTIYSYGAISVSNVTANWNNGSGAYIDNNNGFYVKPVTLSGVNNFNHNYYDGIYVYSDGAVTLSRVTANWNDRNWGDGYDGSGIYVYTYGTITLTCGVAYGNFDSGLYLYSWGGKLVTVKGWYSSNNGLNGFGYNYYFTGPNSTSRTCLLP